MSMSSEITRITNLRNRIRTKLIAVGVLRNQNADLEDCADGVDSITGVSEKLLRLSVAEGVSGTFTINGTTYRGIRVPVTSLLTSWGQLKSIYIDSESSSGTDVVFSGFGTAQSWDDLIFWFYDSNHGTRVYNLGSGNYGLYHEGGQAYIYLLIPTLSMANYYYVYYSFLA